MRGVVKAAVLLAVSALLLAAIVALVGAEDTLRQLRHYGIRGIVAVGGTVLACAVLRALSWAALNRPIRHRVRFRTLLAGAVVGQAGNILTPSTYLGGEPLKVLYVGRAARLPYHEVAGTVLLTKYLEALSFILYFTFSAIVAAVGFRRLLFEQYPGAGIVLLVVAAGLLATWVVLWLSLSRRWHPVTWLVRGLARVPVARRLFGRLPDRSRQMEDQVSRVFCEEGKWARLAFLSLLCAHAVIFLKPAAFFLFGTRIGLGVRELCLLFVASQAMLGIQLTPSGVGTLDGGLIGTFALVGLPESDCMAYLLCFRFWDAIQVTAGALLAARVGAGLLAAKEEAAEAADPLEDDPPAARGNRAACAVAPPGPAEPARGSRQHFPYVFTAPRDLPRYARFRAEGLTRRECALHVLSYLRKYKDKLRAAPQEEIAYFAHQRQLLEMLVAEPHQPGDVPVAMVGDLAWIRDGWHGFLSPEVGDYLNRHEAAFGNLETVISPRFRVSRRFPEFARFNSDPALLASFRRPDGRSTFTALGTANNHTLDYGDRGTRDTLTLLDQQGILHSGVREREADTPHVVATVNGLRIGFYAATWGMNDPKRRRRSTLKINTVEGLAPEGDAEPDLSEVRGVLAAMDEEGADFRIVALHWGFEFEHYPTPRQMQVAREIVGAGADVVLGSHAHLPQPCEVCFLNGYEARYGALADELPALRHPTGCLLGDGAGRPRKALICYSLGNFTTAMCTFPCRVGAIQSLRLRRDPDTGRVDWFAPRTRLVYSVPRHPASGLRRLVFLKAFLDEHGDNRPLSPKQRDDLAFLTSLLAAE